MSKRTLYGHPLSGNVHKVRLALSILGLAHEEVLVDITKPREQSYLAINPLGQIPSFIEDDLTLTDSHAILVYLAKKYNKAEWLGTGPVEEAHVQKWLSFAQFDIQTGAFMIRLHYLLGAKCDTEAVIAKTHQSFKVLDAALAGKHWLVGERVTLADIAVFPYVQLVTDGKIDLAPYPNIVAWCNRMRSQPWYISMPSAEKL